MTAGIIVFGAYSFVTQPETKERLYFEANAAGRLARLDQPTSSGKQMPELWKPQPRFLLDLGSEIRLDERQRGRIREIESDWAAEKASLEQQMRGHSQFLERGNQTRLSMSSAIAGLAGYSELSRAYSEKREAAWQAAVAVLHKAQRDLLQRATKNSEVRK